MRAKRNTYIELVRLSIKHGTLMSHQRMQHIVHTLGLYAVLLAGPLLQKRLPGKAQFHPNRPLAPLDALDLLPTFCRSYRNAADRFEKILGKAVWATAGAHSRSIATASDTTATQPRSSHSKATATATRP